MNRNDQLSRWAFLSGWHRIVVKRILNVTELCSRIEVQADSMEVKDCIACYSFWMVIIHLGLCSIWSQSGVVV